MKSPEALETFSRTGIDVDALRAVADHVETLVDADDLREAAEAARDEALLTIRAAFDAKWGDFWKCGCGGATLDPGKTCEFCGRGLWFRSGYTRAR